MDKACILVIEAEMTMARLLRTILSAEYEVVLASSGQEGMTIAVSRRTDLVILDMSLPQKSAPGIFLELTALVNCPVILLSDQDNETELVSMLDKGAADYIVKPFKTREFLARVRATIRKTRKLEHPKIIYFHPIKIDTANHMVWISQMPLKLPPTEYALLLALAENPGKVLTHQYLAKKAWYEPQKVQAATLRVFISQLRKKIEKDPLRPRYIITEKGIGYRFNPGKTTEAK